MGLKFKLEGGNQAGEEFEATQREVYGRYRS